MNQENVVVSCGNCGTKNRIPRSRLNETPVCGRCRTPLKIPSTGRGPVDITDQTFDQEVLADSGPVLVDCWAPWCGPCRMVAPVLDELAREYAGRIKITKLNVDEKPVIASRYRVQSIPTMLLFKAGAQVNTLVGAQPKQEIIRHLAPLL